MHNITYTARCINHIWDETLYIVVYAPNVVKALEIAQTKLSKTVVAPTQWTIEEIR